MGERSGTTAIQRANSAAVKLRLHLTVAQGEAKNKEDRRDLERLHGLAKEIQSILADMVPPASPEV